MLKRAADSTAKVTRTGARRASSELALVLCGALGCGEPAAPPPWTSIAVRGHHDAVLLADGELVPLFASTKDLLGLCFQARPEVDTSRWKATIWWDSDRHGELAAAAARMAGTVCFERQLTPDVRGRRLEICAEVHDDSDGRAWSVPCVLVQILADDAAYGSFRQELNHTVHTAAHDSLSSLLASLDSISERSTAAGFPFLALRARLIAAHFARTRGGPEGRTVAAALLTDLPPWIGQIAAAEWAAQVEQELQGIESETGRPNWSRMWAHLRQASSLFLATADPRRLVVSMRQANMLASVGSIGRAIETLRSALDECSQTACPDSLLGAVRGDLAWLLITDPLAGENGWAEARAILDDLLDPARSGDDGLTRANRLLNRASLDLRQHRPFAAELEGARALLLASAQSSTRVRDLTRWADLLAGEGALQTNPNAALESCGRALAGAVTARLAAWAAGCVAEAHRRRGELHVAAGAYEQTLRLHESAIPARIDQNLSIDLGRRADDFYRAARVAIERDRVAEAWSLLERLDSLSVGVASRDCSYGAKPDPDAAHEREIAELLEELDRPASVERERQMEPVKRLLRQELGEIVRRRRCGEPAGGGDPRLAGLRAVPLDDEIVLLERTDSGAVRLVRRTAIARTRVTELGSMVRRSNDDEWREVAAPLTAALAPVIADAGDPTSVRGYWLHGSLQEVPLAALPLPSTGSATRWLGEIALVVLYPAAARERPPPASGDRRRTFVVDPSLNLPSGRHLADAYRRWFPQDDVLEGGAATTAAVTRALRSSSWLHVDAHGAYDPAFPELSHLVLADGALGLADLEELSTNLDGANLLSCWTGVWPVTADGGRYGLAGALARAGVPWTIASSTAVADELAADFNEVFYPALREGKPVPVAYAGAMSTVRERWPASQWAAILLVAGARTPNRTAGDGQSAPRSTPVSTEREDSRRP